MFGTWAGGWHEPMRVYGPSGRTPEYGTAKMVEGMKMMLGWHMDAFNVFPVGRGHDFLVEKWVEVHVGRHEEPWLDLIGHVARGVARRVVGIDRVASQEGRDTLDT